MNASLRIGCLLCLLFASLAVRADDADQLKRGAYLALASDCVACHTAPGGKPFAGGLAMATPIGAIVSTNITPSKSHGIGDYSPQQFADALRRGIRADGAHLYPAMPYTSYVLMDDADIATLYAYFMYAVPAVDTSPAQTSLPFPFNFRASMAAWNLLYLDTKPFVPEADKSPQWNRGAYLARGPAHCGDCHTPRNLLMAQESSAELAGAQLGPWFGPNITSDANSGIGGWSDKDIVDYLRTGRAAGKAQAAGPMTEAIDHSLQYLSDADLNAIATYLRSVPARRDAGDDAPSHARGQAGDQLASIRGAPLPDDAQQMSGAQLYDAYCATCHQAHGQGSFDTRMPSLFHNTASGRARHDNLVMVVLDGIHRGVDGRDVVMPGFGKELSDTQVATLAAYVYQMYGNPHAAISAEDVRLLRAGGPASHLVLLARIALAIAVVCLILLVTWWKRRRTRRNTRT
ncbi:MAG TPA: cytochrome c [Rudaea sp.]|nr:cytochrome c [Rudaea sp.]